MTDAVGVFQQLVGRAEEAAVDEVVTFDARECLRKPVFTEALHHVAIEDETAGGEDHAAGTDALAPALLVLVTGLLGLFAYMLAQPKDEFVESAMIGEPIPAFDLPPIVADDVPSMDARARTFGSFSAAGPRSTRRHRGIR